MFDALGSGSKPKTGRKTKKIEVVPVPEPIQESSSDQTPSTDLAKGFSFIEVGPKGYVVGSPDVMSIKPAVESLKLKLSTIEPEIAPAIPAVLPSVNTQVSEDEGGCYADLIKSLIAEFPTKQEGTLLFVTPPAVQIADAVLKLAKEAALCGEVVLVEARENAGNLQRWLALPECPGWQDVVSGKAELEDCLQESGIIGLKVVTAGSRSVNTKNGPRLIVRSPRGLVRTLRKQHRLILIDGGIWSEESGSLGLARECDGICLLVPASKSGSATVEEILGRIEDSGSRLAGVLVLPNQDRSRSFKKAA
ncbi:MAG: hypothetical protein EXS07_05145 [Gemmataceae bacterium]|nr:hypothetical protein [Gemmataceae bacterium]